MWQLWTCPIDRHRIAWGTLASRRDIFVGLIGALLNEQQQVSRWRGANSSGLADSTLAH